MSTKTASGDPNDAAGLAPAGPEPEKPMVLVLDDEADICEAVQDVLRDAGYDTVCLMDGLAGLDYLLQARRLPAAILLDLMMPRMDGWALFERIRGTPRLREIPVVILTAAGPHWGYPPTHVLRKPIDVLELVGAIRNALGQPA